MSLIAGIVANVLHLSGDLDKAAKHITAIRQTAQPAASEVKDALRGSQREDRQQILTRAMLAEKEAGQATAKLREAIELTREYGTWHGGTKAMSS